MYPQYCTTTLCQTASLWLVHLFQKLLKKLACLFLSTQWSSSKVYYFVLLTTSHESRCGIGGSIIYNKPHEVPMALHCAFLWVDSAKVKDHTPPGWDDSIQASRLESECMFLEKWSLTGNLHKPALNTIYVEVQLTSTAEEATNRWADMWPDSKDRSSGVVKFHLPCWFKSTSPVLVPRLLCKKSV